MKVLVHVQRVPHERGVVTWTVVDNENKKVTSVRNLFCTLTNLSMMIRYLRIDKVENFPSVFWAAVKNVF